MPWQTRTAMSLRYDFVAASEKKDVSISELCHKFGISRKTGYKWLGRFAEQGLSGLEDLRCNRHERQKQYSEKLWATIFACRHENPTYGARKIVKMLLYQHPDIHWPSISLVKKRLKESGLIVSRTRKRKVVTERLPLREITAPNSVWSIDFKGWFTSKDGKRCEPLTLMDGYSRYLFLCELVSRTGFAYIKPLLEKAFHEYGKPDAIRSDNGPPFGSPGLRGLSPLSVWLLKIDIWPEKTALGNPGQNGRLERLHRTLKADALGSVCTHEQYSEKLKKFILKYNTERPHESLGDVPPSSVYTKSDRTYHPGKEEEYQYPADYHNFKVDGHGYLNLSGTRIYLSESLAKEYVGIGGEGGEQILYRGYPLGSLSQHRKRVGSPNNKSQS